MGRGSGGFSGGSRGGFSGGSRGGSFSSGSRSGSFSRGSSHSGSGRSGGFSTIGRSSSGLGHSGHTFTGGKSSGSFNQSRPTGSGFGNYSSSPFSSGSSPKPVRPIIIMNPGKTYNTGSYNSGGYNNGNNGNYVPGTINSRRPQGGPQINRGCFYSFILIVVMTVVVLVVLGGLWSAFFGEQNTGSQSDITYSTSQREPLPANAVTVNAGYYTDEIGWIDSSSKLTSGMKSFYDATGVMPYLYLTDMIDGEAYPRETDFYNFAEATYDELFHISGNEYDEAHVLVVFQQYDDDSDYGVYVLPGLVAKTVIDDEAQDILRDYIDRYYWDTSKSNAEFFAAAFQEAGETIMKVTRPSWYYPTIIAGIILVLLAVVMIIRARAKAKKEQDERDQQILNTPLTTFSDAETTSKAEDLAKKYENNAAGYQEVTNSHLDTLSNSYNKED